MSPAPGQLYLRTLVNYWCQLCSHLQKQQQQQQELLSYHWILLYPNVVLLKNLFLLTEESTKLHRIHLNWLFYVQIQIPLTGYVGLIMMQYHWGYCMLKYQWGYFEGMLQLPWQEYRVCSSCSVEESGCVPVLSTTKILISKTIKRDDIYWLICSCRQLFLSSTVK